MSTKEPAYTVANAVEIFYSYAHADRVLRDELEKHLSVLKRQGFISNWHDRLIQPGADWENEIDNHLATSHIILLLVSSDFLASDYCYGVEMSRAMQRHYTGEARVVPIILRPAYWQHTPFSRLQALPTDGKPITQWKDIDLAFVDIVTGLREIIKNVQPPTPRISTPHTLSTLNTVEKDASTPFQDRWESAGPLGPLIHSFIASKQWGQAESTVRMIEEHNVKSKVLSNLAMELAENQEWQRAEAIAYTIEKESDQEVALVTIVNKLIEAKQWERAEAVAHSSGSLSLHSVMIQALITNGEQQRAFALAYNMQNFQHQYYSYSNETDEIDAFLHHSKPRAIKATERYQRPRETTKWYRRSTTLFIFMLVVLIGLAIAFFTPLRKWFIALLAAPGLLIWGTIGLLFIIGVIVIILRRLKNR